MTGTTKTTPSNLLKWYNEFVSTIHYARHHHEKDAPCNTPFEKMVFNIKKSINLRNSIIRFTTIEKGNRNTPGELCNYVNDQIQNVIKDITDETSKVELCYNTQTRRAEVKTKRFDVMLISEWGYSPLHLLGLTSPGQIPTKIYPVDVLEVYGAAGVKVGSHEVFPKRFCGMYVYTDIIDHVNVGDTLAPCLAYVPIDSTFNTLGHYYSNPPKYHRVKATHFHSIVIYNETTHR